VTQICRDGIMSTTIPSRHICVTNDHRKVPFVVDIIKSRHICVTNDYGQVPFVVDIIPSRNICVTNAHL
jgi:hypothetical protein